jgi:Transposase DDE domain
MTSLELLCGQHLSARSFWETVMANHRKLPVGVEDLQGFKYLRLLEPFLQRLHGHAVDRCGNRQLHFDHYTALLLLYFFTPLLTSLRGLQQASELDKVQKTFGSPRASLGALSAAARVFDPALLRAIVVELAGQAMPAGTGKEAEALQGLTAVDGTLLAALPRMAWALWLDDQHRAAKAHLHFDVLKGVPCDATVTAGSGSERDQLRTMLQAGRLYVVDRGYLDYQLYRDILHAQSSFVARVKENVAYTVDQERPLSAAATAAGVIRDVVVSRLGSDHRTDCLGHSVRLVWVATGKSGTDGQPEVVVLCTDRLDLAAELVALAYQYRWSVELFFRWLKCILGCRHLVSTSETGVTIQVYVALIASLLISLWTGKKPSKRTFEMLCFYFSGLASLDELMAHIGRLHDHPELELSG